MRFILRKLRSVRRRHIHHRKHRIAVAGGDRLRCRALVRRERRAQHQRAVRHAADDRALRQGIGRHQLQPMRRRHTSQPILLRLGRKLAPIRLQRRALLVLRDRLHDRVLHLAQRLHSRRLLLLRLDDVVPERRPHQPRSLPWVQRHRRLRVGRVQARRRHQHQLAPRVLAPWVLRVLLRQLRKLPARLQLLQNVLGLGLGRRIGRRVRARLHRNQDVPRLHLLLGLVLRQVRVVVRLRLGVAHRGLAAGRLRRVERRILDLARLRNRLGVLRRVLLEIILQLRVRRVDRLLQILQRHHRVVELHFHPLHPVGLAHRRIRNCRPARHHRLQPLQLHVVLHLRLELRARCPERRLHKVHVPVVADVLPIGEQVLGKRPRPQLARQVRVTHLQVHRVRRLLQHRPLHQDLPRPRHHVRQQGTHHLSRHVLLLQLPLRQLRHILRLDLSALPQPDPPQRPRLPHRRIHRRARSRRVVHQPRNQVKHHRHARGANDDAKHYLDCLCVFLQKTNHTRPATLTSRPASNLVRNRLRPHSPQAQSQLQSSG